MSRQRTLDWYEDQLDREDLSPELRAEYEAEADKIVRVAVRAKERAKQFEQEQQQKYEEIRAQLQRGDVNVIDIVGIPEFGDDYELSSVGGQHVVYSKVARDDQENRHTYSTLDEAVSHYRKLIWDRLYTKYVRSGEVNSLREM